MCYAEPDPTAYYGDPCPTCGDAPVVECEGCGDCQECCNCADTDCDCGACEDRREEADDGYIDIGYGRND